MKKIFLFVIVVATFLLPVKSNEVFIKDIVTNPGSFNHEIVTFEGIVTRYEVRTPTTSSYYLIKDDYGAEIRVNTSSGTPIVNKRYRVSGTVTIHMQEPLIIESNRLSLEERIETIIPPKNNNLLHVVIAALIVIATLLIFFIVKAKTGRFTKLNKQTTENIEQNNTIVFNEDESYNTVKFENTVPGTMKFIPGKLEILNGPDRGKTLMMVGYPTEEGNKVSIGRDYDGWQNDLTGDRKYAHIRVKDESRTLSRMQAEIIFHNEKIYLKNLSKVNTSSVDGTDVALEQRVEIKNGSVIKAGFIEFKYLS